MAAMPPAELGQAVEKAQARAQDLGLDLKSLRQRVSGARLDQINDPQQQQARRQFLESLYDEQAQGQQAFERIIAGNELQDVNFLPRGALAARPVVRVVLRGGGGRLIGYGTGFLIGDGVLITNNHVLGNRDVAALAEVEAFYERGVQGEDSTPQRFAIEPERLFYTSVDLDFSIVAVAPMDRTGTAPLAAIGWLPLIGGTGKAMEGEWLTIIQHPKGERKQVCVRENQLLKRDTDVLWYSTDTQGGSSGSPVFNNDWVVIALHHSGVPEIKDGVWQTVDGHDYDPKRDSQDQIKWVANEGIRVSRIMETLHTDASIARHALIAPILDVNVGDLQARLPILLAAGQAVPVMPTTVPGAAKNPQAPVVMSSPIQPRKPPEEAHMSSRYITVTLAIDDDGQVHIAGGGATEADTLATSASSKKKKKVFIEAPVVPETDWVRGYDPHFLGHADPVNLPLLDDKRRKLVAPLHEAEVYRHVAPDTTTAKGGVLNYNGYSVVMNAERRVAFFSAANINGGVEFPGLSRGPDVWLFDDRIAREAQIGNDFYLNNQIDRGHLTRREDMEWGIDPVDATRRANGTCTWCNCSPQQSLFNQNKSPDPAIQLWGGLEKYILEQTARHYQFKVQAITGPIFAESDPLYRGVRIPLDFWKVVVAIAASGELFATGYVLTQRGLIDVTKLDEVAIEQPFGAFQTYQRPLAEIEAATGLSFTYGAANHSLRDKDPLAAQLKQPAWKRRRAPDRPAPARTTEAFEPAGDAVLTGDGTLSAFEDIVLP